MSLIGIIAKKKDIQAIKKDTGKIGIEIIEITKESIKNLKNIRFDQIFFLENLNFEDEYKYINEIITKSKYLIINKDIQIDVLKRIEIEKPIKLITFGFNSKSTITVSSVSEEKILVCIQRDIEKVNAEIIEKQEKEIKKNNQKIYNNLVVFIINELHNL